MARSRRILRSVSCENLLTALKTERGVHIETLMVAMGAIAGQSAIYAALESYVPRGEIKLRRDLTREDMMKLDSRSLVSMSINGRNFYFGDALNSFLTEIKNGPCKAPLLAFLRASSAAGLDSSWPPELRETYRHVASSVGTPTFGVIRAPDGHRPGVTVDQALQAFWPLAKMMLSKSDNPAVGGRSVAVEHWPMIAALIARQFLDMTKGVIDFRMALLMLMEAAISASKVDPKNVQQNYP